MTRAHGALAYSIPNTVDMQKAMKPSGGGVCGGAAGAEGNRQP